jgi:hypothetical protein
MLPHACPRHLPAIATYVPWRPRRQIPGRTGAEVYPVGMDQTRSARSPRTLYARPGRPAVVVPDLSELLGPTSGIVELPHRLFWQPDRHVDLDAPGLLAWMYETVLTEAVQVAELRTWLHGPTLARLWPQLYLPRGVRRAWEQRHPVLRTGDIAA